MSKKSKINQLDTEEYSVKSGHHSPKKFSLSCKLLGFPPNKMEFRIRADYTQRISEIKRLIKRKCKLRPLRIQLLLRGTILDEKLMVSELDFNPEKDLIMVMGLMKGA